MPDAMLGVLVYKFWCVWRLKQIGDKFHFMLFFFFKFQVEGNPLNAWELFTNNWIAQ